VKLKIGSLQFDKYPVFSAPMEDVTEPSFRYMCKKHGADMLYTEFASSDAVIRKVNKTMKKMEVFEYERPIGVQIFGKEVQSMVEAARIAELAKPDLIDINFGCPVRKVAMKGAGAGLLKNIPLMIEIAKEVTKAVKLPVTAKTRLGWDEDSKHIVEIAEQLQDVGIQALTIHGRTRAQMYSGEADWTLIGEVKNNPRMKIPIIGNGDITTPEIAKNMFNRYGVDAIMIGRGSIGKPWIFRDVKHYLKTGELLPAYTVANVADELILFMEESIKWKGDVRGVIHMRRQFATAFKGLRDFRETRIELLNTKTLDEAKAVLEKIKETWGSETAL